MPAPVLAQAEPDPPPAAATKAPPKVKLSLEGVDGDLRKAALRAIELRGLAQRQDAGEALIRRTHARASRQIAKALEPFGYYHVKVSPSLALEGPTWQARYRIELGEPTRVRAVDIVIDGPAAEHSKVKRAVQAFGLQQDAVFAHEIYEAGKAEILAVLLEQGFLDAQLETHQVRVRLAERSARIELRYQSGPRFRFGDTRFEGEPIDARVLRRYLPYRQGDQFRQDRLLRLQQRLLDADYFGLVDVVALREEADAELHVPIVVRLKPARRTIYTGGVALGTDSGFGVRGGMQRRWVNALGHRYSLAADLSQRQILLGAQYVLPVIDDRSSQWILAGAYRDEETASSTLEAVTASVARQYEGDGWTFAPGMGVFSGDFVIGGESRSSQLLYPEVRWFRRLADDPLDVREGWSVNAEARGGPKLGDGAAFAQLRAEGRLIRPFGEQDRLLLRLSLGALWTDDFDRMPPTIRHFAGGDRSLRGFAFQELGPTNAAGQVIGGKYLSVGSVEYEHNFDAQWGMAVFADAGNAFNDRADFDLATWLGVGLRWRSPVGPVRVDLARGSSEVDSGWRFHLVIGPDL